MSNTILRDALEEIEKYPRDRNYEITANALRRIARAALAAADADQAPDAAPWPDFLGQSIHHGDRLLHPQDGTEFVAVRLNSHSDASDAWRAVYDDGTVSRLCLQIGDKGQAVLSNAARPAPVGAVQAPDGWQLVPIDAPTAMILAIEAEIDSQLQASGLSPRQMQRQDGGCVYDAMLAAAPAAPMRTTLAEWNSMLWAKNGPVHPEQAKPEPVVSISAPKIDTSPERVESVKVEQADWEREPVKPLSMSMCASRDYMKGWNECLAAVQAGQQAGAVDGEANIDSAAVRAALNEYYAGLSARQHGDLIAGHALRRIEQAAGMSWDGYKAGLAAIASANQKGE